MKIRFTAVILLCSVHFYAQKTTFPDDFCGLYKGDLVITNNQGQQTVPMEFYLKKTDTSQVFSYKMIYKAASNPVEKNYKLIVKDKLKGEFVIDENNGILLEANFFDNTLHSVFEVQNSLIISTETFYEDRMVFKLVFSNMTMSSRNEKTEDVPMVVNYPVSVVQNAVLMKQ